MFAKNFFGIGGIIIALLGIGVAIFQDELRPPPPSATEQLKERVTAKGIELMGGEVEKSLVKDRVSIVYSVLGLFALCLGVVSYIRNENHRVSAIAGALGIVAIAWEYVLIGVGIAAVIFVLGAFS